MSISKIGLSIIGVSLIGNRNSTDREDPKLSKEDGQIRDLVSRLRDQNPYPLDRSEKKAFGKTGRSLVTYVTHGAPFRGRQGNCSSFTNPQIFQPGRGKK